MSLRCCYLGSLAVLLASSLGCCCGYNAPLCARTWNCCQCGPAVWHEWFSFPPECCDPCCCEDFSCSRNPYVLDGPTHAQYGPIYDDGSPRDQAARPPARPQSQPYAPTPATGPTPAEELPPMGPSAAVRRDEYGQRVSYRRPVDSPRTSRTLGKPRRPYYFGG